MKEKSGIKVGKFTELIPITKNIGFNDVKKKISENCITQEDRDWIASKLSEFDIMFLLCDLKDECIFGSVTCKTNEEEPTTVELCLEKNVIDELPAKDFYNVLFYSSQWLFKFAGKTKVLLKDNNFRQKTVKKLKLIEFKNSKYAGYFERVKSDDPDVLMTALAVLNSL